MSMGGVWVVPAKCLDGIEIFECPGDLNEPRIKGRECSQLSCYSLISHFSVGMKMKFTNSWRLLLGVKFQAFMILVCKGTYWTPCLRLLTCVWILGGFVVFVIVHKSHIQNKASFNLLQPTSLVSILLASEEHVK